MESEARRRLLEAIAQARTRAGEAAAEIDEEPEAPAAIAGAIREAEQALALLEERLKADA